MCPQLQERILYISSFRPFTFSSGRLSQIIRIWAAVKRPISSFQWRGQDKGMHSCGNKRRPDSFTSAWNCFESPHSNPTWPWGWTFLLTSPKPEKKDEDRHFFPLAMNKSDTQRVYCIFFHCCLSSKPGEMEMDAEYTQCATKKDASLGKIQN